LIRQGIGAVQRGL